MRIVTNKPHPGTLALLAAALLASSGPARAYDLPAGAQATAAEDEGDPRVEVELISDRAALRPGETFRAGVRMSLDPGWHVYFRNPGEAAMATEVTFTAEGASTGALRWPVPSRFLDPSGSITTYGYAQEVLLSAPVTVAEDAAGQVELEAIADFLVCRIECIPGRVELRREWPVARTSTPSAADERALFTALEAALPRRSPEAADLRVSFALDRQALRPGDRARAVFSVVSCDGPPAAGQSCLRPRLGPAADAFFPDRVRGLRVRPVALRPHPTAFAGAVVELELLAGPDDPGVDQRLGGILALDSDQGRLALEVSGPVPRARAGRAVELRPSPLFSIAPSPDETEARTAPAPAAPPLWLILLMALVGGVILNAMPCVLPVLALKVFGLARLAGEARGHRLGHTLAYTLGILATMWALSAVVLSLRAAGVSVGWGFQLQEPRFAAILAALVLVFALGLLGLFEINVDANRLAARVDRARGLRRSFGEGALAVVLATPCSAPLLGAAVGFAFASSAPVVVAVFTALGLGLAAPFALLALIPGAGRLLPRPGRWMELLQQGLAFLLLGTVIWLLWIVGQVAGAEGMTRALIVLLAAALGAWAIARSREGGRRARRLVPILALSILGVVAVFALETVPSAPREETSPARAEAQEWSPEAVEALLAQGRSVFVDFTADWCITCQANERLVLSRDVVEQAFAEADVVLLRADWTGRDEGIRAELARHGRAGVPLYLLFRPPAQSAPEVLPELLTTGLVLEAVSGAPGGSK